MTSAKKTLALLALTGAVSAGNALFAPGIGTPTAAAATVTPGSTFLIRAHDAAPDAPLTGGCSVNAVGHGADGSMLVVTAGHCAPNVGDRMYLTRWNDGTGDAVEVGQTIYTTGAPYLVDKNDGRVDWDGDDYAVIRLSDTDGDGDPNRINPRSTTTTVASAFLPLANQTGSVTTGPVDGATPMTPRPGQLVWVDGGSSGHTPGVVLPDSLSGIIPDPDRDPGRHFSVATVVAPGDSGGSVYDMATGEVLGINSRDPFIGEDTPTSTRNIVSPRMTAHSNADALAHYTADTGDTFTYATEADGAGATPEQLRHPFGDQLDQVSALMTGAGNQLSDTLTDRFGDLPDLPVPGGSLIP